MKKTRRKFTKEFKAKIVADLNSGTKLKDLVAKYKISPVTIRSWVKNFEVKQTEADVDSLTNPQAKGKTLRQLMSQEAEIVTLQRKVNDLNEDLFFLKSLLKLCSQAYPQFFR